MAPARARRRGADRPDRRGDTLVAMSSFGYRVLGFAVWNGGRWYLRRRYGAKPKLIAAGALAGAGVGAGLLVRGRRGGGEA